MIRGTTAQFKFSLPCEKSQLLWATIRFWQPGNTSNGLPIEKTLDHCSSTENPYELCVNLTSEETMNFSDKFKAKVQLRAYCPDTGSVFASHQQSITVYPIHDEIVRPEDPVLPPTDNEGWYILDGESIVD